VKPRRPRAALAIVSLVLTAALAGCGGTNTPEAPPELFSDGGREELPGLGLCLAYLITGSAGGGDEAHVTDPKVDVTVMEDCYGSATPRDVDSLSIEQVWAGNTGDTPPRTEYSHGSTFSQSNSGINAVVVPASRHDEAGRPCMRVTLVIQVQVDATSDGLRKELEPCAGAQA
jgi:hypothetical protein